MCKVREHFVWSVLGIQLEDVTFEYLKIRFAVQSYLALRRVRKLDVYLETFDVGRDLWETLVGSYIRHSFAVDLVGLPSVSADKVICLLGFKAGLGCEVHTSLTMVCR